MGEVDRELLRAQLSASPPPTLAASAAVPTLLIEAASSNSTTVSHPPSPLRGAAPQPRPQPPSRHADVQLARKEQQVASLIDRVLQMEGECARHAVSLREANARERCTARALDEAETAVRRLRGQVATLEGTASAPSLVATASAAAAQPLEGAASQQRSQFLQAAPSTTSVLRPLFSDQAEATGYTLTLDMEAAQLEYSLQMRRVAHAVQLVEAAAAGGLRPLSEARTQQRGAWEWESSGVVSLTVGVRGGRELRRGRAGTLLLTARDGGGRACALPEEAAVAAGARGGDGATGPEELVAVGYGGLAFVEVVRVGQGTWAIRCAAGEGRIGQDRVGVRLLSAGGTLMASRTFSLGDDGGEEDDGEAGSGDDGDEAGSGCVELCLSACDLHCHPDPAPPGSVVRAVVSLRSAGGALVSVPPHTLACAATGGDGVLPGSVSVPRFGGDCFTFSFVAAEGGRGVGRVTAEVRTREGGGVGVGDASVVRLEASAAVRALSGSAATDLAARLRDARAAFCAQLEEARKRVEDLEQQAAAQNEALECALRASPARRGRDGGGSPRYYASDFFVTEEAEDASCCSPSPPPPSQGSRRGLPFASPPPGGGFESGGAGGGGIDALRARLLEAEDVCRILSAAQVEDPEWWRRQADNAAYILADAGELATAAAEDRRGTADEGRRLRALLGDALSEAEARVRAKDDELQALRRRLAEADDAAAAERSHAARLAARAEEARACASEAALEVERRLGVSADEAAAAAAAARAEAAALQEEARRGAARQAEAARWDEAAARAQVCGAEGDAREALLALRAAAAALRACEDGAAVAARRAAAQRVEDAEQARRAAEARAEVGARAALAAACADAEAARERRVAALAGREAAERAAAAAVQEEARAALRGRHVEELAACAAGEALRVRSGALEAELCELRHVLAEGVREAEAAGRARVGRLVGREEAQRRAEAQLEADVFQSLRDLHVESLTNCTECEKLRRKSCLLEDDVDALRQRLADSAHEASVAAAAAKRSRLEAQQELRREAEVLLEADLRQSLHELHVEGFTNSTEREKLRRKSCLLEDDVAELRERFALSERKAEESRLFNQEELRREAELLLEADLRQSLLDLHTECSTNCLEREKLRRKSCLLEEDIEAMRQRLEDGLRVAAESRLLGQEELRREAERLLEEDLRRSLHDLHVEGFTNCTEREKLRRKSCLLEEDVAALRERFAMSERIAAESRLFNQEELRREAEVLLEADLRQSLHDLHIEGFTNCTEREKLRRKSCLLEEDVAELRQRLEDGLRVAAESRLLGQEELRREAEVLLEADLRQSLRDLHVEGFTNCTEREKLRRKSCLLEEDIEAMRQRLEDSAHEATETLAGEQFFRVANQEELRREAEGLLEADLRRALQDLHAESLAHFTERERLRRKSCLLEEDVAELRHTLAQETEAAAHMLVSTLAKQEELRRETEVLLEADLRQSLHDLHLERSVNYTECEKLRRKSCLLEEDVALMRQRLEDSGAEKEGVVAAMSALMHDANTGLEAVLQRALSALADAEGVRREADMQLEDEQWHGLAARHAADAAVCRAAAHTRRQSLGQARANLEWQEATRRAAEGDIEAEARQSLHELHVEGFTNCTEREKLRRKSCLLEDDVAELRERFALSERKAEESRLSNQEELRREAEVLLEADLRQSLRDLHVEGFTNCTEREKLRRKSCLLEEDVAALRERFAMSERIAAESRLFNQEELRREAEVLLEADLRQSLHDLHIEGFTNCTEREKLRRKSCLLEEDVAALRERFAMSERIAAESRLFNQEELRREAEVLLEADLRQSLHDLHTEGFVNCTEREKLRRKSCLLEDDVATLRERFAMSERIAAESSLFNQEELRREAEVLLEADLRQSLHDLHVEGFTNCTEREKLRRKSCLLEEDVAELRQRFAMSERIAAETRLFNQEELRREAEVLLEADLRQSLHELHVEGFTNCTEREKLRRKSCLLEDDVAELRQRFEDGTREASDAARNEQVDSLTEQETLRREAEDMLEADLRQALQAVHAEGVANCTEREALRRKSCLLEKDVAAMRQRLVDSEASADEQLCLLGDKEALRREAEVVLEMDLRQALHDMHVELLTSGTERDALRRRSSVLEEEVADVLRRLDVCGRVAFEAASREQVAKLVDQEELRREAEVLLERDLRQSLRDLHLERSTNCTERERLRRKSCLLEEDIEAMRQRLEDSAHEATETLAGEQFFRVANQEELRREAAVMLEADLRQSLEDLHAESLAHFTERERLRRKSCLLEEDVAELRHTLAQETEAAAHMLVSTLAKQEELRRETEVLLEADLRQSLHDLHLERSVNYTECEKLRRKSCLLEEDIEAMRQRLEDSAHEATETLAGEQFFRVANQEELRREAEGLLEADLRRALQDLHAESLAHFTERERLRRKSCLLEEDVALMRQRLEDSGAEKEGVVAAMSALMHDANTGLEAVLQRALSALADAEGVRREADMQLEDEQWHGLAARHAADAAVCRAAAHTRRQSLGQARANLEWQEATRRAAEGDIEAEARNALVALSRGSALVSAEREVLRRQSVAVEQQADAPAVCVVPPLLPRQASDVSWEGEGSSVLASYDMVAATRVSKLCGEEEAGREVLVAYETRRRDAFLGVGGSDAADVAALREDHAAACAELEALRRQLHVRPVVPTLLLTPRSALASPRGGGSGSPRGVLLTPRSPASAAGGTSPRRSVTFAEEVCVAPPSPPPEAAGRVRRMSAQLEAELAEAAAAPAASAEVRGAAEKACAGVRGLRAEQAAADQAALEAEEALRREMAALHEAGTRRELETRWLVGWAGGGGDGVCDAVKETAEEAMPSTPDALVERQREMQRGETQVTEQQQQQDRPRQPEEETQSQSQRVLPCAESAERRAAALQERVAALELIRAEAARGVATERRAALIAAEVAARRVAELEADVGLLLLGDEGCAAEAEAVLQVAAGRLSALVKATAATASAEGAEASSERRAAALQERVAALELIRAEAARGMAAERRAALIAAEVPARRVAELEADVGLLLLAGGGAAAADEAGGALQVAAERAALTEEKGKVNEVMDTLEVVGERFAEDRARIEDELCAAEDTIASLRKELGRRGSGSGSGANSARLLGLPPMSPRQPSGASSADDRTAASTDLNSRGSDAENVDDVDTDSVVSGAVPAADPHAAGRPGVVPCLPLGGSAVAAAAECSVETRSEEQEEDVRAEEEEEEEYGQSCNLSSPSAQVGGSTHGCYDDDDDHPHHHHHHATSHARVEATLQEAIALLHSAELQPGGGSNTPPCDGGSASSPPQHAARLSDEQRAVALCRAFAEAKAGLLNRASPPCPVGGGGGGGGAGSGGCGVSSSSGGGGSGAGGRQMFEFLATDSTEENLSPKSATLMSLSASLRSDRATDADMEAAAAAAAEGGHRARFGAVATVAAALASSTAGGLPPPSPQTASEDGHATPSQAELRLPTTERQAAPLEGGTEQPAPAAPQAERGTGEAALSVGGGDDGATSLAAVALDEAEAEAAALRAAAAARRAGDDALEAQAQAAQRALAALQREAARLRAEVQEARARAGRLAEELRAARAAAPTLLADDGLLEGGGGGDEAAVLRAELRRCEEEVDAARVEAAGLRERAEDAAHSRADLDALVAAQAKAVAALRGQAAAARAEADDARRGEREGRRALRAENAQLRQQQAAAAAAARGGQQQRPPSPAAATAALEQALAEMEAAARRGAEAAAGEERLLAAQDEAAELRAELAAVRRAAEEAAAASEAPGCDEGEALATLVGRSQERLRSAAQEMAALREENAVLGVQVARARRREEEAEGLALDKARLQAQVRTLQQSNAAGGAGGQTALASALAELASCMDAPPDASPSSHGGGCPDELRRARAEVAVLQEEAAELRARLERAAVERAEAEAAVAACAGDAALLSQSQAALQRATAEIQALRDGRDADAAAVLRSRFEIERLEAAVGGAGAAADPSRLVAAADAQAAVGRAWEALNEALAASGTPPSVLSGKAAAVAGAVAAAERAARQEADAVRDALERSEEALAACEDELRALAARAEAAEAAAAAAAASTRPAVLTLLEAEARARGEARWLEDECRATLCAAASEALCLRGAAAVLRRRSSDAEEAAEAARQGGLHSLLRAAVCDEGHGREALLLEQQRERARLREAAAAAEAAAALRAAAVAMLGGWEGGARAALEERERRAFEEACRAAAEAEAARRAVLRDEAAERRSLALEAAAAFARGVAEPHAGAAARAHVGAAEEAARAGVEAESRAALRGAEVAAAREQAATWARRAEEAARSCVVQEEAAVRARLALRCCGGDGGDDAVSPAPVLRRLGRMSDAADAAAAAALEEAAEQEARLLDAEEMAEWAAVLQEAERAEAGRLVAHVAAAVATGGEEAAARVAVGLREAEERFHLGLLHCGLPYTHRREECERGALEDGEMRAWDVLLLQFDCALYKRGCTGSLEQVEERERQIVATEEEARRKAVQLQLQVRVFLFSIYKPRIHRSNSADLREEQAGADVLLVQVGPRQQQGNPASGPPAPPPPAGAVQRGRAPRRVGGGARAQPAVQPRRRGAVEPRDAVVPRPLHHDHPQGHRRAAPLARKRKSNADCVTCSPGPVAGAVVAQPARRDACAVHVCVPARGTRAEAVAAVTSDVAPPQWQRVDVVLEPAAVAARLVAAERDAGHAIGM